MVVCGACCEVNNGLTFFKPSENSPICFHNVSASFGFIFALVLPPLIASMSPFQYKCSAVSTKSAGYCHKIFWRLFAWSDVYLLNILPGMGSLWGVRPYKCCKICRNGANKTVYILSVLGRKNKKVYLGRVSCATKRVNLEIVKLPVKCEFVVFFAF